MEFKINIGELSENLYKFLAREKYDLKNGSNDCSSTCLKESFDDFLNRK